MLDRFSSPPTATAPAPTSGPDPLTQILLGLRLEGVEYGRCLMHAPWAISFPKQPTARFHFVASDSCWLRAGAEDWVQLNAGDAVLLPRGSAHVLASAPEVQALDIDSLGRDTVVDQLYLVRDAADEAGPPSHVMFCGSMQFNLDPLHPLLAMMPDVIRAGDLAQRDPTVPVLLEAMEREVALNRIGACGILARMADVLAASIIRAWVECACSNPTGWIAALRCPGVGKVLAAIHTAPERDWSVPALAHVMGTSRSRFAQAFKDSVGESPARYVAKIKMFQARRWIAQDGMRITVAADRLGYDSEASFSRAFKRVLGHAPSLAKALAEQLDGR
ncbi:AraC family transcriptional regulator [Ideonella azotifigens]|uniref:AraC family transcriptional regulator n=1 Tax=Ideonella azotifigens TaxID=513160 RepID=A0ABN1KEV5_9BURK|nr:AraC family transcriptional regulator [Ideonella azotifigens]MCD2340634.1 AraC family transcriptional regulator [Ideonella azotifigens]